MRPQPQHVLTRLGDVHIDGVKLAHRGQRLGLIRGNERAGRKGGLADTPRNGRADPGIFKLYPGRLHGGAVDRDLGLGLLEGGLRVVVFLLAHGLDGKQLAVAFRLEARRGDVGLRLHKCRLRAVQRSLVGGGIDLIQSLPRLNVRPFGKKAALDDAADLRPHFRHLKGSDAARQFRRVDDALRLQGDDGHFPRLGRKGPRPPLVAGGEQEGRQQEGRPQQHSGIASCKHSSPSVGGPLPPTQALVSSWISRL